MDRLPNCLANNLTLDLFREGGMQDMLIVLMDVELNEVAHRLDEVERVQE